MIVQSNKLAEEIRSSDVEMSRYLQRVVSEFLDADSRSTSITKMMADSFKGLAGDGSKSFYDRILDSRNIYTTLGLLSPVVLIYPVVTTLGWLKEGATSSSSASLGTRSKELNKQNPESAVDSDVGDNQYEQRKANLRERINASMRYAENHDIRTELDKANSILSTIIQSMAMMLFFIPIPFNYHAQVVEKYIRRNYYEAVHMSNTLYELSMQSLKMAENALLAGNVEAAEYYYDKYISYQQSYSAAIDEASNIILGETDSTERVAQIVFNSCHYAGKVVGSAAFGPKGGLAVDYIFMAMDYGVNVHAGGFDNVNHSEYAINAAKSAATTAIFSAIPIDELGGLTLNEAAESITDEAFGYIMKSVMNSEEAIELVNEFLADFLVEGVQQISRDMMP